MDFAALVHTPCGDHDGYDGLCSKCADATLFARIEALEAENKRMMPAQDLAQKFHEFATICRTPPGKDADTHLIANAPQWLADLVAEVERDKQTEAAIAVAEQQRDEAAAEFVRLRAESEERAKALGRVCVILTLMEGENLAEAPTTQPEIAVLARQKEYVALRACLRDLITLVEMDPEANDPSTDLYVSLKVAGLVLSGEAPAVSRG